ncbi:putative transcriptional regulatory protein Teth514_1449 [Babylonia areolata]|uniref:putative transcriptional regulatory protein Teth514_1449 n=1 Tax=Babylonia areolata TaxID=304850 RepID=UPI003FD3DE37
MELRSAVNSARQLVCCITARQLTFLSSPIRSLYLVRSNTDGCLHRSVCSHSTSSLWRWKGTQPQGLAPSVVAQSFMMMNPSPPREAETAASCVGSVRGMAGHSKWANIRHIKAAKDKEKSRVISEYSRKIRAFARETGQTDPKTSSQLAKLITEAKSKNVPNANIDRVLAQMVSLKNSSPVMFTAKGPVGSVMLIEALTTKMTQTRAELQSIVKKCGFSMFDSGSLAKIAFEEKGVVQVSCPGDAPPDLESYVDIAIEAGAEDVTLEEGEEGNKVLEFVCEPNDVYTVKKELEARQLAVGSAEVVFNTTSHVALDSSVLELIAKAMDKLDEHPDVLRVYINVEEAS